MQEKIIEELRQELKEQIKENQELEKKVDGLVTVIDLAKNYIKRPIFMGGEKKPEDILFNILEILERVNEE